MASLTAEMPSLHTAETLVGVTVPASSQHSNSGGGGGGPSGPSVGINNSGIDSTQTSETKTINNNTTASSNSSQNNGNSHNNTISAAADSSDNQPGTPQPHLSIANEASQNSSAVQHPYASHPSYANNQPSTTTSANTHLNQLYAQHIFSQSNVVDLQQQQQQQQQQLQQPLTPNQHSAYPSYLNSYEQFYQQQQQQQQQQNPSQSSSQTPQNAQQMDFINSNSNPLYSSADYKQQQQGGGGGVRYHPYLHTPTSGIPTATAQDAANTQTATVVSAASSSSLMSPRVVSSTSPSSSSNQVQISGSASSIGSMSAGNPSSPNSAGTLQCKKCGIMCTNESELQEHITNVHGASPYGSSGYASSPYIKEDLQQQTPPSQQPPAQSGNPGEILDLDSQKMLYPPAPGSMGGVMNQSLANSDPLHGLHSMQQRAGINTWDQQAQEGLPPYLQQQQQQQQATESKNLPNNSPYYHQSPKQSPYNVSNSSNVIKTEYQPLIKTEYTADAHQYLSDKSFDPTAPNQPQQMMPPAVSSSPAEFPSTTTGGPQDSGQQNVAGNQQFRAGNFEPPSSSSAALTSGPTGGKAANWKSNEARRPKTYNCTACNKWFTSSGHLKRHYNTTLHKNAVKSSGQPDPATLPISAHHHPTRDPNGKAGRRGAAAAAAANAAQQPPNPVQPPEPPNSPQDYGGSQVATGGLTPLSQYAATPSPSSMYQQQQYQQHQYMSQVHTTTNASPQNASNHHLQQQQTVMNGHPNALAGPSVPPTRHAPMPSSQMRGLLNTTMTSSTVPTTIRIIKSEQLEAATIEEQITPDDQVEELGYLMTAKVKEEYSEETQEVGEQHIIYSPKTELVEGEGAEELEQPGSVLVLQRQQQSAEALKEVTHNVGHHRNTFQLPSLSQIHHLHLPQQEPSDTERHYHNTTSSNIRNSMQIHSPLIISHQQYQDQQQQQHQVVAPDTYTLTQIPPQQQQQLQHNIMDHQPYINMHLGINTQQPPNNMLQLQPPLITTEQQQLPPATTIHTNMVNMLPPSHHHMQPLQQPLTELQPLVSTQLQLDTINTNTPSHITTTNSITNIPSFHHLQQQGSVLPPVDPMLNYPHTIIGNAEVLTLDASGNLVSASRQHQQVIQTPDGQFVQLISTGSTTTTGFYTTQAYSVAQRPLQGPEISSMTQNGQQKPTLTVIPSYISYSPTSGNSHSPEIEYKPSVNEAVYEYNSHEFSQQQQQRESNTSDAENTPVTNTNNTRTTSNKRKRNPSTSSSIGANSALLPSGRIKCLPCDKEFTKICYLTQHNKSFHSGEYPFRCQKCGKRYQSEDVYVTHLGKHKTTDKAHKCDICPKQFHHKTDLRRHIEAIHTGNKQHACDICDKSFCRKDHLRKHLETHNRPRVMAKRNNSRIPMTPSAKVTNKKSKDIPPGVETKIAEKPLNDSTSLVVNRINHNPSPPSATENHSPSSSTISTPSPLHIHPIVDIAADDDDDDFLDDDLDEYEGHDTEENEGYHLTITQYEPEIQSQYILGKQHVYEIVEQQMPMY